VVWWTEGNWAIVKSEQGVFTHIFNVLQHTIHGGPKTAIIISTVTLSKLLYSDNGTLIVARFKLSNKSGTVTRHKMHRRVA